MAKTKHGMGGTKEYQFWADVKARCFNKNRPEYPRYGGRGIVMCPEWANDFAAFYAYVGPRPNPDMWLDRIDNDKGYEPGNVQWSTPKEQANNRRTNVRAAIGERMLSFEEIAAEFGLSYTCVQQRYRLGLRGDDICAPYLPRSLRIALEPGGKEMTLGQLAKLHGLPARTVWYRYSVGVRGPALVAASQRAPREGVPGTLHALALAHGMKPGTVAARYRRGLRGEALVAAVSRKSAVPDVGSVIHIEQARM